MGLTIAQYNVCQQINLGIFSESGGSGQSSGDPCGNCGEYLYIVPSSISTTGTMTITIPYSSLIYNPENVWIAVMGAIQSECTPLSPSFEFNYLNASGDSIGSYTFTLSYNLSNEQVQYYIVTAPVPEGTDTIQLSVSAGNCEAGEYFQIWVTDVYFYSQPPTYYIEPLFFYNQSLTYSITLDITTSDYLAFWSISGGSSGLTSYSACIVASNGTFCANTEFFSGESSISSFQVTGTANNTYQVTWSQELALILINSSCGLDNIILFEVTGYNNILNPSEYTFTIQTPYNGSVSKSYTLLVPVGYFKLLPSYSLSCATSPCTSGFTTFTITIDIETSPGVVIASQQVNVLENQTFAEFNLEDYYGGQTLTVVITLDIDATLSQTVTLTMNFEYEVQAQT
ncbi:hypothetical protein AFV9_gp51 [Betalipothrixvirus uzonense]|uniref:Uncharacterized protein n=1 Tax=Betalipothrixvirus uzonense TaxID=512792 RepID=B2CRM8_9VIRU|nr:hypothetical protein AFV9_gp51 [Acidianus filamentous virus 9]ACB37285.1 hypothetical protein [Acidianus filamentous virus 9]